MLVHASCLRCDAIIGRTAGWNTAVIGCGADLKVTSRGCRPRDVENPQSRLLHQLCNFVIAYCDVMPLASALFWVAYPLLLIAFVYQVGLPDFVTRPVTETNAYNTLWKLFTTTHCYTSVNTQASGLPRAQCFSVSNGKFTRIFRDEVPDGSQELERSRTGHVIPGLWDGHGHLVQFGELLDSVNLFGATSMPQVHQRLVEYKTKRPETGTQTQWIRGIGWVGLHE
jgi:hypothetical protein